MGKFKQITHCQIVNIFKKIFASNLEKSNNFTEKKEVMINISSLKKDIIPSNAEIINETQVPEYCSIGNLIFEKKFHEAIELGNKLLEKTPHSAGVHVNLMDAYFKVRNENQIFLDKSVDHAKLAMLYGHNTGYAQERLAINLEKLGKVNQAIQVCNIVLLEQFHFSTYGGGNKEEFSKRKEKLIIKLSKATDSENSVLFTDDEISFLIEQIRLEDKRIMKEKIEHEKRMKQLEKEIA